jgi:hypothetical protein
VELNLENQFSINNNWFYTLITTSTSHPFVNEHSNVEEIKQGNELSVPWIDEE